MQKIIDKLYNERSLSRDEYLALIKGFSPENAEKLAELARQRAKESYQNKIFIRGLIEISNICKNDCLYCGIRRSNKNADRYRLTKEEILECCDEGYPLGFRTFVMQGGEDSYFNDERVCDIVSNIKRIYPDVAVTLSLGERSYESYKALKEAGADRYLLRHETATCEHYARLHPSELTLGNRIRCLNDLKSLGYQVGCGFMVGSPFQTNFHLARDLKFIEEFKPQMVGIGPFIPHCDTPFSKEKGGSLEMTLFLLSVVRLILPNVLLPATTALGTISENGREKGILAGANVCMPNLSPKEVRHKYMLYNNKKSTGAESADEFQYLKERMEKIGYHVTVSRGDFKPDIL